MLVQWHSKIWLFSFLLLLISITVRTPTYENCKGIWELQRHMRISNNIHVGTICWNMEIANVHENCKGIWELQRASSHVYETWLKIHKNDVKCYISGSLLRFQLLNVGWYHRVTEEAWEVALVFRNTWHQSTKPILKYETHHKIWKVYVGTLMHDVRIWNLS